jgi:hypothetical protein
MATPEQEMLSRVERDPRRQFGWGPSALASPEERAAYEFIQKKPLVESGQLSPAALPEEYGGRPTGSSRRAIRMQQAWDAGYALELERQKQLQELARAERDYNLRLTTENRLQKDQDLDIEAKEIAERENQKVQAGADFILKSIRGGMPLPSGGFSAPILPTDPNAAPALYNLLNMDGAEHPVVQKIVPDLLQKALQYQEKTKTADTEAKVGIAKELGAYGMSIADFTKNGQIDFVAANEAIGKAWAKSQQEKPEEAAERSEIKNIDEKITSAEKRLLEVRARGAAAQKRLEARPSSTDFKTEVEAATIEQGILEDEINRLNRLKGGGEVATQPQQGTTEQEEIPKFNSVEEAEAANLKAGTVIEINGRRARID